MIKFWTPQELEVLRRLYPDCKNETLGLIFKRPARAVGGKANKIGLKKSDGFKNSLLSGRISKSNDVGLGTRFKTLQPGWNKGKKQSDYMSPEMIERTAKTRFKKGQDPHNTVAIGHERITKDGYVEVKTNHFKSQGKNDNFELKHRLLWVENYGPIPDGMNVSIKGNDRINFTIDDLELISKKENLERNFSSDKAIVKRFLGVKNPEIVEKIIEEIPEIINQKRQTILLNQQIKKEYEK